MLLYSVENAGLSYAHLEQQADLVWHTGASWHTEHTAQQAIDPH